MKGRSCQSTPRLPTAPSRYEETRRFIDACSTLQYTDATGNSVAALKDSAQQASRLIEYEIIHRKYMHSHFLEEGLNSSQEALLSAQRSRPSISSSIYYMPTPSEPDLERGDSALKVPANPFAPPSPSPKPTPSPNTPKHQPSNPTINRKFHPQSSTTHRRQSQHRPLSKAVIPTPHDPNAIPPKLLKLRTIIGISTPESLSQTPKNPFSTRPAPNLGIYTRIIHEEHSAKFQFYFTASVINICYFSQICIAATLTALGASTASKVAITVLGAVNTVLAGVLTYLKGQGLPVRLRHYWTGLRKCREFVEEKEREVEAEGWGGYGTDGKAGIDVDEMIETIVRMYHDVRQTAEDNTPDTYLPMKGSSANALARSGAGEKQNGSIVRYPDDSIYESEHDGEVGDASPRLKPTEALNTSKTEGGNTTAAEGEVPANANANATVGSQAEPAAKGEV
ncbi:MAG: hypothetical protein Q9166_000256 [cf. Caloplaca sp. 2 TL-2023]